ncbi:integron gene cassette protein [Microdochium trichocladiopsis]|uniref:Integron gene cassette protein n=1 Tax=Microdochium trichocladiopsis TaxID=1682393 RepID=A0A9P8Y8Z1_9PEZI|nr:integron gene cassette protein [Microdochium trichocladiopsis]KAH7033168.1 integron gene cassette protein [Microdochium trichocladiopsis]
MTGTGLVKHPGELSLQRLLATLTARLHPSTYVFAVVRDESKLPPLAKLQMLFREAESEGVTVILTREDAEAHNLEHAFPCKKITLNVNSSLDAVGFMAVIATRLASYDMGVNPVSAFYHDHLFVPLGREDEAMRILAELAEEKRRDAQESSA